MPSIDHESLLLLFRERPSLAAELLRAQGVAVPSGEATLADSAFSEVVPVERRADLVVVLDGTPPLGLVVEIQLRRDDGKRYRWPLYVAALEDRLHHPVFLLVVAPSPAVARWARRGRPFGSRAGFFAPEVISRKEIPRVRGVAEARAAPELAVISILAHGRESGAELDAQAIFEATADLDTDRARVYHDLIWAGLGAAAREALESLMDLKSYELKSPIMKRVYSAGRAEGEAMGRAEGEAMGRAEGLAEALLLLLDARGFALDAPRRARIAACQDRSTLDGWLRRAVTAESVDELFE